MITKHNIGEMNTNRSMGIKQVNADQDITLSVNKIDAESLGVVRDVMEVAIDTTNTGKISVAKIDEVDVTNTLDAKDYTAKVVISDTNITLMGYLQRQKHQVQ